MEKRGLVINLTANLNNNNKAEPAKKRRKQEAPRRLPVDTEPSSSSVPGGTGIVEPVTSLADWVEATQTVGGVTASRLNHSINPVSNSVGTTVTSLAHWVKPTQTVGGVTANRLDHSINQVSNSNSVSNTVRNNVGSHAGSLRRSGSARSGGSGRSVASAVSSLSSHSTNVMSNNGNSDQNLTLGDEVFEAFESVRAPSELDDGEQHLAWQIAARLPGARVERATLRPLLEQELEYSSRGTTLLDRDRPELGLLDIFTAYVWALVQAAITKLPSAAEDNVRRGRDELQARRQLLLANFARNYRQAANANARELVYARTALPGAMKSLWRLKNPTVINPNGSVDPGYGNLHTKKSSRGVKPDAPQRE